MVLLVACSSGKKNILEIETTNHGRRINSPENKMQIRTALLKYTKRLSLVKRKASLSKFIDRNGRRLIS
jgi:hypothetical protein